MEMADYTIPSLLPQSQIPEYYFELVYIIFRKLQQVPLREQKQMLVFLNNQYQLGRRFDKNYLHKLKDLSEDKLRQIYEYVIYR